MARLNETIKKRFEELIEKYKAMPLKASRHDSSRYYDTEQWQQWATSALNLLQRVFGESSVHFRHFNEAYVHCSGYDYEVAKLLGVFRAAKEDYEGGYLFEVSRAVSGEVFADFLLLARHSLQEGAKDVAAVLSCAALENTLKRYATSQGIDVTDRSMQDLVGALKSKGLVSGAQKTLLDTMPKIRDYAMHANWGKIRPEDVSSVIGFVEQFLIEHFS